MKVMKRRHLLVLALLMTSCDPMQHTKCDDALVKQVASPDRTLEIEIYNRSCAGGAGLSTYAVVHDPRPWSWPRPKELYPRRAVLRVPSNGGGLARLDQHRDQQPGRAIEGCGP